jgi:O-methyltransferase
VDSINSLSAYDAAAAVTMESAMSFDALRQYARNSKLPLVKRCYHVLGIFYGITQRRKQNRALGHSRKLSMLEIEKTIVFSIQYARGLEPGDIAEFGVFSGQYAMVEGRELASYGSSRAIHLFDSWNGNGPFSQKDMEAPEIKSGEFKSEPRREQIQPAVLLRQLRRIYRGPIHIYKGFFKDTVPTIKPETKFVMVVMDSVSFSSTDTVFNHLFANKHIAEGAVLLLPGWNLARASPDQMVRYAWALAVKKFNIRYSDEGRYYSKGAKFIIHSYD